MALLVSDSRNAAYNGKLGTALGLIKSESNNFNLGSVTSLPLSTGRRISFTPSTGHNNNGVNSCFITDSASIDRSIYAALQESLGTCTATAASDQITFAAHGLSAGSEVSFTTTGTLPGGLTVGNFYYVKTVVDANNFTLSATSGGSTLDITSAGVGTHTLHASRGSELKTAATMTNNRSLGYRYGGWSKPFKWSSYAVTAVASKWSYLFVQTGGTAGTWSIRTSDGTNPFYAELTDIQSTYVDNTDQIWAMDFIDLNDGSYQLKRPSATAQMCIFGGTPDSIPLLTNAVASIAITAPSAARTLKIDGAVVLAADAWFRVGTPTAPIPLTAKVTIDGNYKSAGTLTSGIYGVGLNGSLNEYKEGFVVHGAVATGQWAELKATASQGQKLCYTNTDISSWNSGDRVVVTKADTTGLISQSTSIINTLNGAPVYSAGQSTVTFNENIASYDRLAASGGDPGGVLVNLDGYSVTIKGGNLNTFSISAHAPTGFYLKGTFIQDCNVTSLRYGSSDSNDEAANLSGWLFEDCCITTVSQPVYNFFNNTSALPASHITVRNTFVYGTTNSIGMGYATFNNVNDGTMMYDNVRFFNLTYAGLTNTTTNQVIDGLISENCSNTIAYINNASVTVQNCRTWANSWGYGGAWVLGNGIGVGLVFQNNFYDKCQIPIKVIGTATARFINETFGRRAASTSADIGFAVGGTNPRGFITVDIESPLSDITITGASELKNLAAGSYVRITNDNNTLNNNTGYLPNGYFIANNAPSADSLTAYNHTSTLTATNRYNNYTRAVTGAKMYVGVDETIQNAAFYGGADYTLPTLNVYADDLETPVITATAAANTSKQTLSGVYTFTQDNKNLYIDLVQKMGSTCSEANSGVKWQDLVFKVRGLGKTEGSYSTTIFENTDSVQQTIATLATDPYWSVTNAVTLAGYTDFTIDHVAQTVTFNGNTTVQRLYDYAQYNLYLDANMGYDKWFSTLDGVNFTSTYNIVDGGFALTGGGSITMSGSTYTRTGTYDGIIITSSNRTVHVTLNGIVSGSTVQIYNTTDSSEIYNAVVAATSLDYYYSYTADKNVRIRVRKADYIAYEATGTITETGLSLNISQEADDIYTNIGIDGSTVTECSLVGSTIKIYVDDPDNQTTAQRIYAWYKYSLSTTTYIGLQPDEITAQTEVDYIFNNGLTIVNLDTSNSLFINGGNIDTPSTDGAVVDVSNGASIVIRSPKVVYANGGSSSSPIWQQFI